MNYDSRPDTEAHIARVKELMLECRENLMTRARVHDASKLEEPEKSTFDYATPRLAGSTYGSDEYKGFLVELKPALAHHYAANSHHPEHYANGVDGMSLLDVIEMLCDWKAAGERHKDGSIARSLKLNRERFKVSDQLQAILENTAIEMGWLERESPAGRAAAEGSADGNGEAQSGPRSQSEKLTD